MAVALVKLGTVATGTTSVSPTFGQSTTAGNLLILWVADNNSSSSPPLPSGWSSAASTVQGSAIFYKPNCGAGETAPTLSDAGSVFMAACLGEFSGADTSAPRDRFSTSGGTTSPLVLNLNGTDLEVGELFCTADLWTYTMSATKTTSDTYNNVSQQANVGSNDATSTASHYRFGYAVTTGNSVADQNSATFTTTNVSTGTIAGASFKLPQPAAEIIPSLTMAPLRS
jgi:hypothetical protein